MSELRQDLVSGDWILLAPGRATRPRFLDAKRKLRKPLPKRKCPFEDLSTASSEPPLFLSPEGKNWNIAVIRNKYPAVTEDGEHSKPFHHGIYLGRMAIGTHNLLITRDHYAPFAALPVADAVSVFATIREFHRAAAKDACVRYISSFYNYGTLAGSSVWHPHYQMLALPITPDHVEHSLRGASDYFRKHKRCVRCDIIRAERMEKTRVIAENAHAVAIAPYASKKPFEISVLPKHHFSSLRDTSPAALRGVALLTREIAGRFKRYLNDPDFNFYIHDTPFGKHDHRHHHWHVEMVPRMTTDAGFELSTSIIINIVDPDHAAAILRGER